MKEVKSFFTEDNRLNKGYTEDTTSLRDGFYRKKMSETLPPPDVLAAYEEMHPGTFEKLLFALEKEQKHRHALDQTNIQVQLRAHKMGRLFGFFTICMIGYIVLELSKQGMLVGGLVFAAIAFAGIFSISLITGYKNSARPHYDKRHNNREKREYITPAKTIAVATDALDAKPKPSERRSSGRQRRRS
ncbi:MAG: DUF2335 domain-containing protein [Pseudomonadota bacterium]